MALNSLICVDVPLRNCSLTHSLNVVRFVEWSGVPGDNSSGSVPGPPLRQRSQ